MDTSSEILNHNIAMGVRENLNICNLCDYTSGHEGNFRMHWKTHSGEKSYKYTQCNYASAHACNLRTHLQIHSGEKFHKCNQFDYTSVRAGDLRTHLQIHSGKKSYKFKQCDLSLLGEMLLGRM